MMFLGFCERRWVRSAKPQNERFALLTRQAKRRGLAHLIDAANRGNAGQLALMRIDTQCIQGYDPYRKRADKALGDLAASLDEFKGS